MSSIDKLEADMEGAISISSKVEIFSGLSKMELVSGLRSDTWLSLLRCRNWISDRSSISWRRSSVAMLLVNSSILSNICSWTKEYKSTILTTSKFSFWRFSLEHSAPASFSSSNPTFCKFLSVLLFRRNFKFCAWFRLAIRRSLLE